VVAQVCILSRLNVKLAVVRPQGTFYVARTGARIQRTSNLKEKWQTKA